MGVTVTGKLNKAAQQFQAGESIGFGVRLGVKYYDRQSKANEWTNYKAVIFAKAPGQIQFLQDNLVEGAIVEVTGEKQKIEVYEGQQGTMYTIEILEAKVGHISSGLGNGQNVQNSQPAPVNNGAAQYQQNAPAQPAAGYPSNQPQQQQYTSGHPPPRNQPQGVHQQQAQEMDSFDDDIPF